MTSTVPRDHWDAGDAYDRFMGRWSRLVARQFVAWLAVAPGADWLDVGCGTGTLLDAIQEAANPRSLSGVDPSAGFLATAAKRLPPATDLRVGDARHLAYGAAIFDAVVAGLVLNFVPQPASAIDEMRRVARPGGTVGGYVWDYADGMGFLRHFWDAVIELDPAAAGMDEGPRFPICRRDGLTDAFGRAGLAEVAGTALEIPTTFADFDDLWEPFLGGQGPGPAYVVALDEERRAALRATLRARLPVEPDGSIHLTARAWAARGTCATAAVTQ